LAPKVWWYAKEKCMKKQIGLVLVAGLLTIGCRPLGLPVPLNPVATTTTTTTAPTTATTTATTGPTTTPSAGGLTPASLPPAPDVDVDLADLDNLLTEIDAVLSDVDSALNEGEEK
jgi:hypothetical protein